MAKRSNGDNQSGGSSRAAKKRAKRRQQQELQQKKTPMNEEDSEIISDSPSSNKISKDSSGKRKKKIKFDLPLGDSDNEEAKRKVPEKKRKKKSKEKQEETGERNDGMELSAAAGGGSGFMSADYIIDEMLSQLNPYEILFPEKLLALEDANQDNVGNGGDPNPLELILSITAEKRARAVFNSILAPSGITADKFYQTYFEKKPFVISKSKNLAQEGDDDEDVADEEELKLHRSRFDGFLSKEKIKDSITNNLMMYGKDLNVTNYCKTIHGGGKARITLDQLPNMPDGGGVRGDEEPEYIAAETKDVFENFESGCTVRLLCPQKHNDEVHSLLSNMECEFGCMVGSNAYLTPGGSQNQGFAPHYDDIEALVLQLEGYKRWLVYPPFSKVATLPRESSKDFTEDDMKDVRPVIDIELGPGDVLYMPRGWIHQANTCRSKHHSLHLTVSSWQHWSWADYLEIIIPEALNAATVKATSLRSGLPRNFLSYMGTMHEQIDETSENMPEALRQLADNTNDDGEGEEKEIDHDEERRKKRILRLQEAFKNDAKKKIMRVCKEALSMVSTGCDQISKQFLSDRQPPAFTPEELKLMSESRVENGGKIWPNTMVRLAKPGIAHLVIEEDKAVLYHSADNSRVYHETPLSPLEFEIDDAPALEALLTTVEPHWICVQDLIHGDIEDKMEIAQSLFDEGILAMYQGELPDMSVETG
mmetsp:Transcript_11030/g.16680  ORF Transcript_11030/g.16680 Transcript_11030/m.16680 type:complete len:706 (-) Transcript_11030:15-2132(-)